MSESFTKFPNWLLDNVMPACDPNEWRVVCAVARMTIGWGKDADKISMSQFHELTGMSSRTTVTEAINSALKHGHIKRKKSGRGFTYSLRTGTEIVPIQKSYRYDNDTDNGTEIVPQSVQKSYTQKKERKERKAAAGATPDKQTAFAAYQDNIGQLTPILASSIGDWVDEVGEQWVIDAVVEAALNNGRSWRYVEAILKRWQREGRAASGKESGNGDMAVNGRSSFQEARYEMLESIQQHVARATAWQDIPADAQAVIHQIGRWADVRRMTPEQMRIKYLQVTK